MLSPAILAKRPVPFGGRWYKILLPAKRFSLTHNGQSTDYSVNFPGLRLNLAAVTSASHMSPRSGSEPASRFLINPKPMTIFVWLTESQMQCTLGTLLVDTGIVRLPTLTYFSSFCDLTPGQLAPAEKVLSIVSFRFIFPVWVWSRDATIISAQSSEGPLDR